MDLNNKDEVIIQDENSYNKKIKSIPKPEVGIGIDTKDVLFDNIIAQGIASAIDISKINSFSQTAQSREQVYQMLDTMCEDSQLSAVLETYAEDATETNDKGNIVWCESSETDVAAFVKYLLDTLNVDKHIYKWTHSLCKYGDVYLRLYRESEYNDLIFNTPKKRKRVDGKSSLNEDVKIKLYKKNDRYMHYLEMVPNPAQVFELTRFGKTSAYIQTDVQPHTANNQDLNAVSTFLNRYRFNKNDVELFPPTEFVHGSLEDNSSRTPEQVELFVTDDKSLTYQVKRGQSLLYSTYKIWRQLMLLENSVLLNRVTQSSIVRVIGVEVGDMPKENVQPHLMNIKQLIEQKAAYNVGNSMSEYTNPGPVVNNVYVPTRNQQGVITTSQIGGDVKIGDLADLDYYQDKLFGNLRVPKQYFGVTDDNAGFSGGQSLSIISSRYAKMIKRIQNTMIQMLTDAINLILIDTGNEAYINKFTLKMQPPTTQEEVDRRENISSKVGLVRDVMDTLTDIESVPTKLKIAKSLLSNTISDNDVIQLIQAEIDAIESNENNNATQPVKTPSMENEYYPDDAMMNFTNDDPIKEFETTPGLTSSSNDTDNDILPTPAELDIGDVSDSTNPEFA